jgi:hypothetical protein
MVIKALDPDWIRIRIGLQPQPLDPDPEKMNTDPKHWLLIRIRIDSYFLGLLNSHSDPSAKCGFGLDMVSVFRFFRLSALNFKKREIRLIGTSMEFVSSELWFVTGCNPRI